MGGRPAQSRGLLLELVYWPVLVYWSQISGTFPFLDMSSSIWNIMVGWESGPRGKQIVYEVVAETASFKEHQ